MGAEYTRTHMLVLGYSSLPTVSAQLAIQHRERIE